MNSNSNNINDKGYKNKKRFTWKTPFQPTDDTSQLPLPIYLTVSWRMTMAQYKLVPQGLCTPDIWA